MIKEVNKWIETTVGKVMEIKNNLRKPISESERKKIQGEYPYYGPTRIQDYINQYTFNGKYVLIGEDGDHFLKYKDQTMTQLIDGKFNVNNHAHILQGTEQCTTEWFYYYFQHKNIFDSLTRQGAGRYKLTKSSLEKMKITCPTIEEQKKIVDILSTWDLAIDKQKQLIEKKKEFKKGLMQRILSGEVRFKEFNDKWEKRKIGTMIEEDKVIAKYPDINKRLTVRLNLNGISKREVKIGEIEGATTHYIRRAGQFIYGKQNLHKGAFAIIPKELDGFQSSSDLPSFNFKKDIYPLWFFYYLSRENYYTQLEKIATGTGSKRIQPKEFLEISIITPSYKEQIRIAEVLKVADKEIKLLEKELEALKLQKKGLMQRLLTGEVRVNVE